MTVDLPFPHKLLWPNGGRGNPRAVAGEVKKHKQWAFAATLEALGRVPGFTPTSITIHVHAKPKGPLPDKDNCIAAAKSSLDGIAAALKATDRHFPAPLVVFANERDGRFVVELTV